MRADDRNKPCPFALKPTTGTGTAVEGRFDNVRCVVPMVVMKDPSFISTIGYYSDLSFKARLLRVITRYDLQIFQHAIARRRERIWRKYQRVAFEDD